MSSGGETGKECQFFKCVAVKKVQVYVPVFKPVSWCALSCGALSPMNNVSAGCSAVVTAASSPNSSFPSSLSPDLSTSRIDMHLSLTNISKVTQMVHWSRFSYRNFYVRIKCCIIIISTDNSCSPGIKICVVSSSIISQCLQIEQILL